MRDVACVVCCDASGFFHSVFFSSDVLVGTPDGAMLLAQLGTLYQKMDEHGSIRFGAGGIRDKLDLALTWLREENGK